ncbi:MAG TPA: hypothetical protein VFJ82_20475 [Longimicrobium sp.]|nr:hypothetical protein [Longimicrobium sp.]
MAVGVVAMVIGVVVLIGIVAALAIPRSHRPSARTREAQGEALLRWAYTAEQTHRADHGTFTASVDSLEQIFARPRAAGPVRYTLQVTVAGDLKLCLDAVPVPGSGAREMSMDALGSVYRDAGCSGGIDASVPPGSGDEMGARQMMLEVHRGMAAYRAEHGAYPTGVPDLVARVRQTPVSAGFELVLRSAGGGRVCVAAVPREPSSAPHAYSVDQGGTLFAGDACAGRALEHFAAVVADTLRSTARGTGPSRLQRPSRSLR